LIRFYKDNDRLILYYANEYGSDNWVQRKLNEDKYFFLNKTFRLENEDLIKDESEEEILEEEYEEGFEYKFIIGEKEGEYYRLKKKIFGISNDFYFHSSTIFKVIYFNTQTKSSILPKIDKLIMKPTYIGGNKAGNGSIPIDVYESILKFLPNTYETKLYSDSRIESILSQFLETENKARKKFNAYLNKKTAIDLNDDISKIFDEYEIEKLGTILDQLEEMLSNENSYSEKQWQDKILKIILLLFPKYIAVFKEVEFRDIYSNKKRRLDYVFVDYLGHIDIVEIKKPMDANLVSKSIYRDNHIPKRELSGTIMQIEKYIYYLNKWGKDGETKLTKKYNRELPTGMNLKITNPNGLIIMGRELGLTKSQLGDLEIIKRKYKNVMDIITYDDLIKRIKVGIEQMKKI